MPTLIRTISVLFLALAAVPAQASNQSENPSGIPSVSPITISEAWVRPPAVAGRPAALYFTLLNGGPGDSLVAASTPAAGRAELHQHLHEKGVMSMKKVETVSIPANGQLNFAPMGYHVMLFNPGQTLTPGTKIPVTLTFKGAGTLHFEADVRTVSGKTAAPAPKGGQQHH